MYPTITPEKRLRSEILGFTGSSMYRQRQDAEDVAQHQCREVRDHPPVVRPSPWSAAAHGNSSRGTQGTGRVR